MSAINCTSDRAALAACARSGVLALLLLGLLPAAVPAQGQQPFSASLSVSPRQALPGASVTLQVRFEVPDGHFIYRDMTDVEVAESSSYAAGSPVFPAGQIKMDKFSGEMKELWESPFTITVPIDLDPAVTYGDVTISADVSWQGCNDTVCYFPTTQTLSATLTVTGRAIPPPPAAEPSAAEASPEQQQGGLQDFSEEGQAGGSPASQGGLIDFDLASERGLLWMYIAAFLGGILISLTPCVLPIVPLTITVIGARGAESRAKSFALSAVYVLGIAVTYSTLGVVAASTGALFGSLFQNTWFLVFAIALFTLLAFGLFGAYELQLPAALRNRLMSKQGKGWGGVFFVGLVAGLVASPCVGPVLVGVLAFIAQTGSILFGFTLLFVFALGMGVLFLVVGTFSGEIQRLPTGPWMTAIENGLGAMMLGVAFYYLWILLDPFPFVLILGATLVTGGVYTGAFLTLGPETAGWGLKARKALGIMMVASGLYFFVGGLMTNGLFLPPMGAPGTTAMTGGGGGGAGGQPGTGVESSQAGVEWNSDLEAALMVAGMEQRPVMIDFTADWCVACKELDHFTFSDARVVEAFQDFVLVRIDMTNATTPQNKEYQRRYEIYGLPSVTFLTPSGRMLEDLTVTGFVNADRFLQVLEAALQRSQAAGGM